MSVVFSVINSLEKVFPDTSIEDLTPADCNVRMFMNDRFSFQIAYRCDEYLKESKQYCLHIESTLDCSIQQVVYVPSNLPRRGPCDDGYHCTFDQRVITVFGASNYCNYANNRSAVLHITQNGEKWAATSFQPIKYILRNQVVFTAADTKDNYHLIFPTKHNSHKNLPLLQRPVVVRHDADIPTPRRLVVLPGNHSKGHIPLGKMIRLTQSTPELIPLRDDKKFTVAPPTSSMPKDAKMNPRRIKRPVKTSI